MTPAIEADVRSGPTASYQIKGPSHEMRLRSEMRISPEHCHVGRLDSRPI